MMASADVFTIEVVGKGGHAARPQTAVDPVLTAAHIIVGLQSLVSRNVDPNDAAVVTVSMIHAGEAPNVIPNSVLLKGTVRTLAEAVRDTVEARMKGLVTSTAAAFGARAEVDYLRHYPVTVNHERQADFAVRVAGEVIGPDGVDASAPPAMAAEDFSFMLNARPGAFIRLGNGPSSALHTDAYDFTDEVIPAGVSYWVHLAESALEA
jgi:hippurate hydrolase